MELLTNYLNDISQGNESLAAAMMLSIVGIATWILRALPGKVKSFFWRHLIVELEYNNSTDEKEKLFEKLNNALTEIANLDRLKTMSIGRIWMKEEKRYLLNRTLGYGLHFLWFKRRPVIVRREKLSSGGGTDRIQEILRIYVLSIHRSVIMDLLEANQDEVEKDSLGIFGWRAQQRFWGINSREPKRAIDTLALNPEMRGFFKRELDFFVNNEERYKELGLAYKLTFILHGITGSGKTSIIKALASEYDFDVLVVNISTISDEGLEMALSKATENSFIVIEDFDSCKALHDRNRGELEKVCGPLTLTGFLNALDGICALHKSVVFMTTNHLDVIDSAVTRPGRVDHVVELPLVNSGTVQAYFERLYPELIGKDLPYSAMRGCDINSIVFNAKTSAAKVEALLNGLDPGNATRKQRVGEGMEDRNVQHPDCIWWKGVGSSVPAGWGHKQRGQRLMPHAVACRSDAALPIPEPRNPQ